MLYGFFFAFFFFCIEAIEIEKHFFVCENQRQKISIDKHDCYDIVGYKKEDCFNIVNEIGNKIHKNDYFEKLSNDIVVYFDNKSVYRTNCTTTKKIRIADTIELKNSSFCVFDLPVEYQTEENSFDIGYLTKGGVIRRKSKSMSCETPDIDSFESIVLDGQEIVKSGIYGSS
jgi:hypothetical protein